MYQTVLSHLQIFNLEQLKNILVFIKLDGSYVFSNTVYLASKRSIVMPLPSGSVIHSFIVITLRTYFVVFNKTEPALHTRTYIQMNDKGIIKHL